MKTLIIHSYEINETPKRATITFSGDIPQSELRRFMEWLKGEHQHVHSAKQILTVNLLSGGQLFEEEVSSKK